MRVDFHSHILPGIDDGARSADEAVKILEKLLGDGVDAVVLTPHFYRERYKNAAAFIEKRKASFERLLQAIGGNHTVPELILGSETYYYPSLFDGDWRSLCIGDTGFLLLELPFAKFSERLLLNVGNAVFRSGCKIILAHIERYLDFGNSYEDVAAFAKENHILCQMNCDSLADTPFIKRRKLLKLLDDNVVQLLGTDTHGLTVRPPRFSEAERIIKKHDPALFQKICEYGETILNGEKFEK